MILFVVETVLAFWTVRFFGAAKIRNNLFTRQREEWCKSEKARISRLTLFCSQ